MSASRKANRYLNNQQQVQFQSQYMFSQAASDGIGTLAFVCSACTCFGCCYPGSCFQPVTLYGVGQYICGYTTNSMCICCICNCYLAGCWTPLSNFGCCSSVGLVMRVG